MVYTSICVASILVLRRVLLDKRESGMYHSCQTFYDNNSNASLSIFSVYWNIQKNVDVSPNLEHSRSPPPSTFSRSQPISPLQALSLALVFLALAATNRTIPHKASIPKLVGRRIEESKILRKRVSKFCYREPGKNLMFVESHCCKLILNCQERFWQTGSLTIDQCSYLRKGSVPWVTPTCRGVK